MKPFVIAANWKLNKNSEEASAFAKEFLPLVEELTDREIIIFPPALIAHTVASEFNGSPVKWGGQNSYYEESGAFTGENSPKVLKEMGADYVLVGHSERRTHFAETNELLAKKVKAIQELNMTPMLCVGETLEQREGGQTKEVIVEQLKKGLELAHMTKPLMVAYEPVWAIGTGKVASVEQAEEAHSILRQTLIEMNGSDLAGGTSILYGGSVKPDNAPELARQENIDGFLVGGASLKPDSFSDIAHAKK